MRRSAVWPRFQLHHTGIKMLYLEVDGLAQSVFQLHHTGIKISCNALYNCLFLYFNCTIQELKWFMRWT